MRPTHGADRVPGRHYYQLVRELARRAVAQRPARMDDVVVLEPVVELTQHARGIRTRFNRLTCIARFQSAWCGAPDRRRELSSDWI